MKRMLAIAIPAVLLATACTKAPTTTVARTDSVTIPVSALGDTAHVTLPPPAAPPETVFVKQAPPPPAPRRVPPRRLPPVASAPAPTRNNPEPASAPLPSRRTLAQGTTFNATALDSVHSRYTVVGDAMRVRVNEDVTSGGRVVIPAGSVITLTVAQIDGAGSRGEKGTLVLDARAVSVNGREYPIAARATDYQYEMKARGVGAADVAKTGAGAVIGGLIGHLIGGGTGTVIGAVAGGAGGAAIAAKTADRDIIVHSGASVTLQLTEDFSAN